MTARINSAVMPSLMWAVVLLIPAGPAAAAKSSGSSPAFLEQVRANFAAWDLDHNGELSKGEIEQAVSNPKVSGKAAAAAVALRRAVRNKAYRLPPLTMENIVRCVPPAHGGEKLPDFALLYAGALERIGKANRQLFGPGGPTLDDLHQGRLGDCFCLAPLGAMLHRNPRDVVNMFQVARDGSLKVMFGGGRTVAVQPLSDGELAITAADGEQGAWVKLYEKAVGTYRARTMATDDRPTALSIVAKGGSAGIALELLTGHAIERFSCSPWRDANVNAAAQATLLAELRGRLTANVRSKRLVCGGTAGGVKVPGVLGLHAYGILSYDPAQDEVLLWNPIGGNFHPTGPAGLEHGYPTAHGQFRVPLAELVQFFGGFSFETEQPWKD